MSTTQSISMRLIACGLACCIGVLHPIFGTEEYTVASDLGTSAQGIGIGRVIGFSEAADVIFENPASLRRVKSSGFSLFSSQVIDANYHSFSLSWKLGDDAVGVGYYGTNIGGIVGTSKDLSGNTVESSILSVAESIFKLGYQSSMFKDYSVGVAATVYSKDLSSDSAVAGNVEVGISRDLEHFSYSLVARNILPTQVQYRSGATEALSFQLIPSIRVPMDSITIYGQAKWIDRSPGVFLRSIGAKWDLIPGSFSVTVGGSEFVSTIGSIVSRMSVGTSLVVGGLSLQYAYEKGDYEDDGNQHYFSMAAGF